jgi:dephospho-CoA kinase
LARRDLEQIIHPIVRAQTDAWFASLDAGQSFAVADIPLLYETGRDSDFDDVVVTACAEETQIRRVMHRDSVTEQEARQRLAAQLPTAEKVSRADYVINTDGSFEETNRQVRSVYEALVSDRRL